MPRARSQTPSPTQQGLIRVALLVGALLLGGAIAWLASQGRVPVRGGTTPASTTDLLRALAPAIAVTAVVAAAYLRWVVARTPDRSRVWVLRVVAWAVGEGAALLGGVYWMLSGDASRYVIGLIAMLATFVIVPLRAR